MVWMYQQRVSIPLQYQDITTYKMYGGTFTSDDNMKCMVMGILLHLLLKTTLFFFLNKFLFLYYVSC